MTPGKGEGNIERARLLRLVLLLGRVGRKLSLPVDACGGRETEENEYMVLFPLTNLDRETLQASSSFARSVARSVVDVVASAAAAAMKSADKPSLTAAAVAANGNFSTVLPFLPSSFLRPSTATLRAAAARRRHWRLLIFSVRKKRGEIPVDVATQPKHLLAPSGYDVVCL